jgi:hypothetical protein
VNVQLTTLPPSCAKLSRNSGSLKVLHFYGPVQDSDWIDFFRKCETYLLQSFIFELRRIFEVPGCLYFVNSNVPHDEALRYKLEGRGFDSRWFHGNFSLT